MVPGVDHFQCQGKVLTTLSTAVPGNSTLYLCPWEEGATGLIHFRLAKNLLTCQVLSEDSFYLFNGSWIQFSRDQQSLSQLNVEIRPHPVFDGVNQLFLKVSTNKRITLYGVWYWRGWGLGYFAVSRRRGSEWGN